MYFIFFKQKAAYEIRPRDWSSDVCSSDLDDMAVHDGAGGVDDRVRRVVAVGEHRIERGDRAAGERVGARALDEARDEPERGGRIALHGRRLAERQADLALGM